jgi:hypothetical protein|tara:strand:- start:301 stop:480 length:180 start_codon:yes stop_codon:yes gene_type:complete
MAKKKRFKKPETSQEELENFRLHIKMINEKTKAIGEKYRKWWDKDKKTWKKGFKGHGHS